jgi:hypothetical protein
LVPLPATVIEESAAVKPRTPVLAISRLVPTLPAMLIPAAAVAVIKPVLLTTGAVGIVLSTPTPVPATTLVNPAEPEEAAVKRPVLSTVKEAFVYAPGVTAVFTRESTGVVPPVEAICAAVPLTLVTGAVPLDAADTRPSDSTVKDALVYDAATTPDAATATVGFVAVPPTVIEPSAAVTDNTPVSIASTYCSGTNWLGSDGVGTVPLIRGRAPNVE